MDIGALNVMIEIQKNEVVADAVGNRRNTWRTFYRCHATAGGESGSEKVSAGQVVEDTDITFTIRFCKLASMLTEGNYRVVFGGVIYDIVRIDHMNFKRKSLKMYCRKVRR